VEALLRRSVTEDDENVHGVFAELLVAHYGVKGAHRWVASVVVQNTLDDAQLERLRHVDETIENSR